MLPSILAKQLQQGIQDYLATTFPMTNAPFAGSIASMFDKGDAVTHAPYISVKLPFRKAEKMPDCFEGVKLPFLPYVHQEKSYQRLVTDGGRSTLVATGTGSGKTECFLNPVLEYCYQHRHERGIKALIIYPMNALATDQAGRMAKSIFESPRLAEAGITAGMYVGGGRGKGAVMMSKPDKENGILGVITDHETMINNPPDILLTNYKMLDYLLVRPKDAGLWRDNRPDTLKFIVVDEFHTFDGAQGTDLACLLRRLKSRLYTPTGYLCCVGTSATMGGRSSNQDIIKYAEQVFGENFDDDALITEDRLRPEEFFADAERSFQALPTAEQVESLWKLSEEDDEQAYLQAALDAWFPQSGFSADTKDMSGRIRLGQALKAHAFFQDVLDLTQGNYWQDDKIYEELKNRYPVMKEWRDKAAGLDALFSLVSFARSGTEEKPRPFLFVQVQLWLRELRRLLGRVSGKNVTYMLAPDLNDQQRKDYLPVVNCRDCGATGWAAILDERNEAAVNTLETFYNLYFNASDKIVLMYPGNKEEASDEFYPAKLCPNCHHLTLNAENEQYCPNDHGELIDVLVPKRSVQSGSNKTHQYVCPFCGSRRGISLMGLRSTTEISASISQLMASRFNDDKKTLAFSDSVQDAAHRAGFFNARTWRFGLRGAIQHYILNGDGAGKNLDDFTRGFCDYWEKKLTREEFVSFFIPPNMTWMQAYQELREKRTYGKDKYAKRLLEDIRKRLSYEIMLEYGVTSRIGRTLEKSSCSCLTFAPEDIQALAERVQERIINELGIMSSTDEVAFQRMVIGWLTLLRQHGAFDDRVYYGFCQENVRGRYQPHFLLPGPPDRWWLPGLQSGRNNPRFLCSWEGKGKTPFIFESYRASQYLDWIERCFGGDDLDLLLRNDDLPADISKIILLEALHMGILHEIPMQENYIHVYALAKDRVYISADVHQLRCDVCGTKRSFAGDAAELMAGASCARKNCSGYLVEADESSLGYYGRLYSSGDLVRIHAHEHTGLLEREDREQVENDFKRGKKEQRRPWDPNVLSCTPTLELGIDIGDLSSVILCSVPPGKAQFLQRVGRAGRTDGNSLVMVTANTRPHDLYFYADPLDMMQGSMAAPHIFLKASAVLKRQFTAFCFDNWVKSGIDESAIPQHLGQALTNLSNGNAEKFPFNYLNYVQRNLTSLFQMFTGLFARDIDKRTQQELEHFAKGNGLAASPLQVSIKESFDEMADEIDGLNKNIIALDTLLAEYKAKTKDSSYDAEIKELKQEKHALLNVKKEIRRRDTFNFLSDEGMLPNYAFPEEGITLKAVLFRRDDEDDNTPSAQKKPHYTNRVYEYQRAASSAISEFAPNNSFYAGGHHFTINRVDLHSSQPERWRLCPDCAHAERETEQTGKNPCPHCGSLSWEDIGQVRDMLKVKLVYSHMDMAKSMIDDGNESRQIKFYTKQLLVDVDEAHDIEKAYAMNNDEFPFGYEFVKKAVLREINFGEADISKAEEMTVNGEKEARKGFRVCKYCGCIMDDTGTINHAPYCPVKKKPALAKESEDDCLFLYREFQTEVLRLLIPETATIGTKVKTESFTAAFMLGMREYFGNVDHLRAAICEVPVKDADYRKQYLVIYDSVPGGTGYLKQLLQHDDALIQIFEKALQVLENCSCGNDPEKDGCYHCLYAYRQSQNIGNLSRKVAIQLLHAILSGKDNIKEIAKLDQVATNHLFDSELERQFVVALEKSSNAQRKIELKQSLVHDKQGYIMNIHTGNEDEDGVDYSWEIEPQVSLDMEQGVSVKCKPDFVLWPNFADDQEHLPVTIFTDGFTYHKDEVADDTLKREAIHRSGNFRVWSLSYKDVQEAFAKQDPYATQTLDANKMPLVKGYNMQMKKYPGNHLSPEKMTALELLLQYLSLPKAESEFQQQANAYAAALLNPQQMRMEIEFNSWQQKVNHICEETHFSDIQFAFRETIFGQWHPNSKEAQAAVSCLAGIDMKEKSTVVAAILEDRPELRPEAQYEAEWNGLWHFCNVMQFANTFIAVTERGLEQEVYLALNIPNSAADTDGEADEADEGGWDNVLQQLSEFADEGELAFVHTLQQAGVPVPDVIMEDLMDGDTVIDNVELGWSQLKCAFILQECDEARHNVEQAGWQVFDETTEDVKAIFGGHEA